MDDRFSSISKKLLSSNCCRRKAKLLAALFAQIVIVWVGSFLYLSLLQPHAHT
jgi:hypothetical protein